MTSATLGEVADFINGFAFKPEDWHSDGLPIVRIQNLTDATKPINYTTREVPDRFRVRRGELLVSWSATLGVFAWDRTDEALVNQHIFRVVPSDKVEQPFLRHMLSGALGVMQRHLHGATMQHVNRREFLSTEIPLPSLPEQRRIAAILDHADDLRAKRRQMLARLDVLMQSVFQKMFGSRNDERVETGQLMPTMRNGVSPASHGQHDASVLTLTAITRGAFDPAAVKMSAFSAEPSADKRVSSSDFLMCRGNGNKGLVGAGAFSPVDRPDLVFPDTVIAGRVDTAKVTLQYLDAAWRQPDVRRQIESVARTTSGIHKVNQRTLSAVTMPVPPLSLQEEFGDRQRLIGGVRSKVDQALTADDELFTSLQSRAFRGEL